MFGDKSDLLKEYEQFWLNLHHCVKPFHAIAT